MEHLKDLNIVITGGAGFIGSHLAEKLLSLGAEVTIIDNFIFGSKIEHLRGREGLSVIEGDIRDARLVAQTLNGKHIVIHLAAYVGVEETQKMPLEVLDVEIQGTLNVLNSSVESGIKMFVFGSSSEVYGNSESPMKEDDSLSPRSTYAVAKLVGEEYCHAFYQKNNLDYICLRFFNVYGPRQDERFVIPRFVSQALSDESLIIYGDGNQTRDFTYIDDVINMTLHAITKPETRCQTINLGTGIMTTINDVASLVIKTLDSTNTTEVLYVDYDAKRPKCIEVFNRVANITRARQLLLYELEISLPAGIKTYINWRLGR